MAPAASSCSGFPDRSLPMPVEMKVISAIRRVVAEKFFPDLIQSLDYGDEELSALYGRFKALEMNKKASYLPSKRVSHSPVDQDPFDLEPPMTAKYEALGSLNGRTSHSTTNTPSPTVWDTVKNRTPGFVSPPHA